MKNIFNKSLCLVHLTYCIISYGCTFPNTPDSKKVSREKLEQIQALITTIEPNQTDKLYELIIKYQTNASVVSASLETRWRKLTEQVQEIQVQEIRKTYAN